MKPWFAALSNLAFLVLPMSAHAVDADTFQPTGSAFDGQGTLQLHHPGLGFEKSFYSGVGLSWADDPIVMEHSDGLEEALVHTLIGTRVVGGYNVAGRVRVDLAMPLYPYAGAPEAAWSGFSFGDLELGALIPLLPLDGQGTGVAVHTGLRLPTGGEYTGQDGLGLDLAAAAAGKSGALGWAANLGFEFAKTYEMSEDLKLGTGLDSGLGLTYDINQTLLVGGELTSMITLAGGLGPFNKNPAEGHLYVKYGGDEGLVFTSGAGTGLVAGVGAPDVRLFALISYHSLGEPPVYDQDADGILDEKDKCPLEAEDMDSYQDDDGCPDLDNDQDGIPDLRDQCARQAEDMDGFKDLDGCPDRDSDGIMDSLDNCIDHAGPATTRGCPDADNDRIPDNRDACPDQPADPRADPARSDGCPKRVVVTRNKIEILEKIHFETGKSKIRRDSNSLLDEIAEVLADNPDIKQVEVSGHTDNQGAEDLNMRLSQARAEAVMMYLVKKGEIDPERLLAKGYGPTRPVSENETDEGRAANRRVEFLILAQ